jgi:hypothetical protein
MPIRSGRCWNDVAGLLEADPQLAKSLASGVEALLAEGDLSEQSRRELEQVHYGVRLLGNS